MGRLPTRPKVLNQIFVCACMCLCVCFMNMCASVQQLEKKGWHNCWFVSFFYIICFCVYIVACSFVKRIMLLVGKEQNRSPLPLWWEHQTESILSLALYAHIPTSLILRAVEVEVQLPKLIPEDETENRVRTNPEVASSPTLVEAPKAFRAEDLEKAVSHTRVEEPLPSSVQALVVETRRDHVKWRHEERDSKATDHASHQGIQPAVFRKNLRKQRNEWMKIYMNEWKFKYMVHNNFHTKPCMFKKEKKKRKNKMKI